MMLLPCVTLTLLATVAAHNAPGVPPRQQQQHQQQHQQFNAQQMNVQEGQPPAQGHGHGHGSPPGGNKMRFQSEIHNADHIIEHLQNVIKTKPKDQMSEEELEFHYFKMHDYDNNNKLDGVEIGKALTHFHDDSDDATKSKSGDSVPTPTPAADNPDSDNGPPKSGAETHSTLYQAYSDEVIGNLVDVVLSNYDKNDDGYVEYFEYKMYKVENQRQP